MMKFSIKKGFTIIETLVTVAIFTLALGAIVSAIIMTYRSQNYSFQQSLAINEARKGIETMVKELREAKMGDDGSYIIEKAEDYEISFYSDIDKDGDTERVRYSIYQSNSLTGDCVSYIQGGSCNVDFHNFSSATIGSQAGCSQCAGAWQGCTTFDVTDQAADGSISFTADGSAAVGSWGSGFCDWQQPNSQSAAYFPLF